MTTPQTYIQKLLEYRVAKHENRVNENGWVALAGLYWLKEGKNLIGANPMCEVILPDYGPTFLGVAELKKGVVRLQVAEGVQAKVNGRLVQKAILKSSREAKPSFITWDDLRMVVHQHQDKFGIRIWDNKREERFTLKPSGWFAPDKAFIYPATFTRYPEPKRSQQPASTGETVEDQLDGYLTFKHEGTAYTLDVTEMDDKKLFVKFRDASSGKETYPPCRYLYTPPHANGKVVLDFNYAYSPPCAFTAYATCTFAPPQNKLPFRVDAGEMYKISE